MNSLNLDKIAQDKAREMLGNKDKKPDIETLERLVTKALGVLQSQGVYALMLFLFSRTSKEKETAPFIRKALYKALLKIPNFENNGDLQSFMTNDSDHKKVTEWYSDNIAKDLNTLLLVRDLYEQTLIYARFHAKAAKEAS